MSVPFWGYRCELSQPMIAIMSADLPHTLYLKDKGADPVVSHSESPYSQSEIDAMNEEARRRNREVMEELKREAAERRRNEQWEKVSIEEILNDKPTDSKEEQI